MLYLYLISQTENGDFDTYDSAVVVAPDEETARQMDPATGEPVDWDDVQDKPSDSRTWCSALQHVVVRQIGVAREGMTPGVVCASFNAG